MWVASTLTMTLSRWTILRQFGCVLVAAFLIGTILALVASRNNTNFHDLEESGSDVMRLTVIEAETRTCVPAKSRQGADVDRKQCRERLNGDPIPLGQPVIERSHAPLTADDYVELAKSDCNCFRSRLGYFTAADTSAEERAFPIAFSLLTYENLEQTERLLRLIYRSHNVYCIHVDRKSPDEMHRGIEAVASCLPNVIIARPAVNVTWGEITVVQAEMLCMGYLLAHSGVPWKYFINLVARDLPLKTNEELVKILKTYDGANDIQGTRKT